MRQAPVLHILTDKPCAMLRTLMLHHPMLVLQVLGML